MITKNLKINYINNCQLLNSFKLNKRNLALKVNKRVKKCDTIKHTRLFFDNLIKNQHGLTLNLLKNNKYIFNPEFLLTIYKINDIYKDKEIDELIGEKMHDNLMRGGLKTDSTYYQIIRVFYENLKNNPDHPLTKELLRAVKINSFLFHPEEKKELIQLLSEKNKKKSENNSMEDSNEKSQNEAEGRTEVEENIAPYIKSIEKSNLEENGRVFAQNFAKLKLKDEHVKIYLNEGKKKITLKSQHFQSKIKIIGLDDNKPESLLKALNYVDKDKPNTILLQRRPVNLNSNSNKNLKSNKNLMFLDKPTSNNDNSPLLNPYYTSLLQQEEILHYCKEYLTKNPKFKINTVEKLVYEENDTLKSISYIQSLILKSSYALNNNPDLKVVLTDIPIYSEIENIIKNIISKDTIPTKDNFHPADFFTFLKLNFLFERYFWLRDACGDRCPACDSHVKFYFAHLPLEALVDELLINLQGAEHIRVKNISSKIIKSLKLGDYKDNTILVFVEEKYFYVVLEKVIKDLNEICEGKNFDAIEKVLLGKDKGKSIEEEFNFKIQDMNSLISSYCNENKEKPSVRNEIINKLALVSNIFKESEVIDNHWTMQEMINLNHDDKIFLEDVYRLYKDRLHFVDEMGLRKERKYDYKCYPNEILINKYLN